MTQSTRNKKDIIQWVVTIGIIVILFTTGLHTEVIGGLQRLVLATGISKPDIPESAPIQQVSSTNTVETSNYAYNMPLQDLNGKQINLQELKGKVVFMNLWASWCPPCIAEMPSIHNLYKKMDTTKVAFVMLSLDEDPQKAKKFIDRKGYSFPVYLPAGSMPADFHSNAIPTTFILGKDGKILARHEGMADYDNEEFSNYLLSLTK
ncbi:TlpA disulfide reductase family protein [Rhodocytophaga aerolata]|uniref:TlpA disulfide reductase family protein n=1 Tax=Rhodocytophaga aerolata TaxID=455078 RepID=A0ABT8REU7_9BACT|nr:TlpA disulfide reductase family protein [Rhodocytophaga aerolata]MDO1449275.1 TlpA disulfide reductase family protein [Rhodocytophaga aerolata]